MISICEFQGIKTIRLIYMQIIRCFIAMDFPAKGPLCVKSTILLISLLIIF